MGLQSVKDVTLIRHAYVKTSAQNQGIGSQMLKFLLTQIKGVILVGTWQAANWAINSYERNSFELTSHDEKDLLLGKYWNVSEIQKDNSVVLKQTIS